MHEYVHVYAIRDDVKLAHLVRARDSQSRGHRVDCGKTQKPRKEIYMDLNYIDSQARVPNSRIKLLEIAVIGFGCTPRFMNKENLYNPRNIITNSPRWTKIYSSTIGNTNTVGQERTPCQASV